MIKINNKHGIEIYYEFSGDVDKINILDSNGNYFNDLYYEDTQDINNIINMLENTTLRDMNNFFTCYPLFETLEELQQEIDDNRITEDNDYVNIFKVNDKKYYVWSE